MRKAIIPAPLRSSRHRQNDKGACQQHFYFLFRHLSKISATNQDVKEDLMKKKSTICDEKDPIFFILTTSFDHSNFKRRIAHF